MTKFRLVGPNGENGGVFRTSKNAVETVDELWPGKILDDRREEADVCEIEAIPTKRRRRKS